MPALSCALLLLLAVTCPAAATITKGDFPPGFIFGTGSSAYQVRCSARATYIGDFSGLFSSIKTIELTTADSHDQKIHKQLH
jgi:hypothetical protein